MVFGFCMMNWVLLLWKYLFSSFFNPFTIGHSDLKWWGLIFEMLTLYLLWVHFTLHPPSHYEVFLKKELNSVKSLAKKNPVKFAFDCRRSQKTVYSWWLMCQILGSLKTRPACIFCVSYRYVQWTSGHIWKVKKQKMDLIGFAYIFEN